jgi:hypothetical protein
MEMAMRDTKQIKTETVSKNATRLAPTAGGELPDAALAQVSGGAQEDHMPTTQSHVLCDGSVKPAVTTNSILIGLLRP